MSGFTARETSRLAGFDKPWMLNHLEREQIFVPEKERVGGHGKHRGYTFRDLVVLRAINRLLRLGARPKRIRDAIRSFYSVCPPCDGEDHLLEFARSSSLFVVTGDKVIYCETPDRLVDLAKQGQLAFTFMVDASREIAPAIEAGMSFLSQLRAGRVRNLVLLEETAKRFGL